MSTSTRFDRPVLTKVTLLTAGVLMLGPPAHAADLSTKAPMFQPVMAYNWTGVYLGANFGFAFDREDVSTPLGISATDPSGALGGFQLGYNYQFSSWLLGIEAEFDWTAAQGTTNFSNTVAATSLTSDHKWYGTLDGRLGYVMGPLMLYVKGGGAWMNADYRFVVNSGLGGAISTSPNRGGWNVGTGFEYMLTPRWSAKLEYDYLDFGTTTQGFGAPFGTGVTIKTQVNEVKAGVNYHFGMF